MTPLSTTITLAVVTLIPFAAAADNPEITAVAELRQRQNLACGNPYVSIRRPSESLMRLCPS